MKLSDVATILEQAGLPLTYRAFAVGQAPVLPYLVYYEEVVSVQGADNRTLHQIKAVRVELVFDRKDEAVEDNLEKLWSDHELFFEPHEEIYIDTERLFVKSYSVYLY